MDHHGAHVTAFRKFQGATVHSALAKELSELTKGFRALDCMIVDEDRSIVLETSAKAKNSAVAEPTGMRRLAVTFDGTTAKVQYDDLSGKAFNAMKKSAEVDFSELPVDVAVQKIVEEMVAADHMFAGHVIMGKFVREERRQAAADQFLAFGQRFTQG